MFEEFWKAYGGTLGKVTAYVTAFMMLNKYVQYKAEEIKKSEEQTESDK